MTDIPCRATIETEQYYDQIDKDIFKYEAKKEHDLQMHMAYMRACKKYGIKKEKEQAK